MNKPDKMPLWVQFAFANIERRKAALWLVAASVLFALYCIPWPRYFPQPDWLGKIFLIADWDWFAMMVPITLWYWLSLRWADRHGVWVEAGRD
jgi:hypothetical protein